MERELSIKQADEGQASRHAHRKRLTSSHPKIAILSGFSGCRCAKCVPDFELIRPASEPVAPFPLARSEFHPDR